MNERELVNYYNKFNEDKRLSRRHGVVEFETAIKYINMYLSNFKDAKILDVGAGTGRYSMYFSNLGYDVTAVELVKHNLRVLEKNCPSVKSYLGNAIDLSSFKSNSFDVVILFGPMYHLISFEDKVKALNEAKRAVKDNGYIFISYYINDYAIMKHGFIDKNIKAAFEKGNVNKKFHVVSKENDLYSFVTMEEIDKLKNECKLVREKIISQDGLIDYFRREINSLDEEEFKLYLKYHFSICIIRLSPVITSGFLISYKSIIVGAISIRVPSGFNFISSLQIMNGTLLVVWLVIGVLSLFSIFSALPWSAVIISS